MTLLNLNKNFSLKNMFKSKYLLKPLVAIVILQMVLVPVAPVLAEEIQNLNNFSLETGTSTEVTAINIVDPVVSTTNNVILLNTDNRPLQSTVFDNLLINNTANYPINNVTTSFTTEVTNNTISTSSVVINLTSSTVINNLVENNSILATSSTTDVQIVIPPAEEPVSTINNNLFLLDELVVLKEKNINDDQDLANAITVYPQLVTSQNIKEGFYNVRIKTPDTVMNYEIMYFKNNYFYDMIYKPLPSKVIKNPIDGKFILKKEDMPYTGKKFNRVHESGVNLGKFLLKEEVYMEILSDDYNPVILALNLSVDKRADYSVKMIKK